MIIPSIITLTISMILVIIISIKTINKQDKKIWELKEKLSKRDEEYWNMYDFNKVKKEKLYGEILAYRERLKKFTACYLYLPVEGSTENDKWKDKL